MTIHNFGNGSRRVLSAGKVMRLEQSPKPRRWVVDAKAK
jgi:hypothetical protein